MNKRQGYQQGGLSDEMRATYEEQGRTRAAPGIMSRGQQLRDRTSEMIQSYVGGLNPAKYASDFAALEEFKLRELPGFLGNNAFTEAVALGNMTKEQATALQDRVENVVRRAALKNMVTPEQVQTAIDNRRILDRGIFSEGEANPYVGVSGPGRGRRRVDTDAAPQEAQRATNWSTRAVEEARARGESLGTSRGSSEVYATSNRNIGIDAGDAAQRARDAGIFRVLGIDRNVNRSDDSSDEAGGTYENAGKPTVNVRAAYLPPAYGNPEGAAAEEYEAASKAMENSPLSYYSEAGLLDLLERVKLLQQEAEARTDARGLNKGGLMKKK